MTEPFGLDDRRYLTGNAPEVAPKPAIHAVTTVPPGSSALTIGGIKGPVIDMVRAEAKPAGSCSCLFPADALTMLQIWFARHFCVPLRPLVSFPSLISTM